MNLTFSRQFLSLLLALASCTLLVYFFLPDEFHFPYSASPSTYTTDDEGIVQPSEHLASEISISQHDGIKPTSGPERNTKPLSLPSGKNYRIAIVESCGCHDEVFAALVHSFGSQTITHLDLYQKDQRYQITDILDAFQIPQALPPRRSSEAFAHEGLNNIPDIVVATSCEFDINNLKDRLNFLVQQNTTYLFCVVHHANSWVSGAFVDAARPWIDKGRVSFITLSPHVAMHLEQKAISQWKTTLKPPVRPFVPVFPVDLPPLLGSDTKNGLSFSIQGNYEPWRRDYHHIFSRLGNFINTTSSASANISLHLIGHGDRPTVPKAISSHVFFDEYLSYPDFYALISRSFALLPAFATDEYYTEKASSSIPAALIGGTPLVGTRRLLDTYSYLPEGAVYMQEEGGTDMNVVGRILEDTPQQRVEKMQGVRKSSQRLIERNVELVGEWIKDVTFGLESKEPS